MSSPLLWYLNRATGTVVLVLFTLVLVLGTLSTFGRAGRWSARVLPRFATQTLHRQLSAVAMAMLVAHVVSAVVDEYVDIRWWQAVVPFGAAYRPFWLALGTLTLDLTVVVVLTSLVRSRLDHRQWRLLHVLVYPAWVLAVAHGLGMGTDVHVLWSQQVTLACALAVGAALALRVLAVTRPPREPAR